MCFLLLDGSDTLLCQPDMSMSLTTWHPTSYSINGDIYTATFNGLQAHITMWQNLIVSRAPNPKPGTRAGQRIIDWVCGCYIDWLIGIWSTGVNQSSNILFVQLIRW